MCGPDLESNDARDCSARIHEREAVRSSEGLMQDIERNAQLLRMKLKENWGEMDLDEIDFRLYQIEQDASRARMLEQLKDDRR
tara:strand:+ start:16672 stop:16920 length:249 start_codon:yes stop_codon:yes gene_type:complete